MANSLTATADFASLSLCCTVLEVNDKFPGDQLYLNDEKYEIYLCGCVLNIDELLSKNNCKQLSTLICDLYAKHKRDILKILKGSYTLLVLEKQTQTIFVANDLLSKKSLYHYHDDKFFAVSNSFFDLSKLLVKSGVTLENDPMAAAMMMSEGFLWDEVTWAKNIKYLRPFEYLYISGNGFSSGNFEYAFASSPISYGNAVDQFDLLFKNAVSLQFKKAEKENFTQLASLSAGMDTRSTVLYAHSLGYKSMDCFTYSQSGSVDDTVAKKIALDYSFNHVFYPLDDAQFLLQDNEAFLLNDGEQTYCGATGALSASKVLDGSKYGIIHTGLLGGELMGDVQLSCHKTPVIDDISKTDIAIALGQKELEASYQKLLLHYSCYQHFALQKHLRACQNFNKMTSHKFESFSPFMDEEVYLFLASIPTEYKYERKLYVDWMNKYLPNDYITTYMYGKPRSNEFLRKAKYAVRIVSGKVFGKSKYDMNPFDYWSKTNLPLVHKLQSNLCCIVGSDHLRLLPFAQFLKSYASEAGDLSLLAKAITGAKAIQLIERLNRTGEL